MNNHIKLAKFHFFIAIVYTFLILLLAYFTGGFFSEGFPLFVFLFILPMVHFILIYSSIKKYEFGRKVSVFLGVLMVAAFPIGTILAMYYLPCTDWKNEENL